MWGAVIVMTPFERALVGELEGSHGGRVLVGDVHGATALHHYAGLNSQMPADERLQTVPSSQRRCEPQPEAGTDALHRVIVGRGREVVTLIDNHMPVPPGQLFDVVATGE